MQPSSTLAPVAPIIFLAIAIAAVNWIDLARGKNRTSVAYPLSLLITLAFLGYSSRLRQDLQLGLALTASDW